MKLQFWKNKVAIVKYKVTFTELVSNDNTVTDNKAAITSNKVAILKQVTHTRMKEIVTYSDI